MSDLTQCQAMVLAAMSPIPAGWSAQSFEVRVRGDDGEVRHKAVFGWVAEPFGVFCRNAVTSAGPIVVSTLAHVPTGYGLALFIDDKTAARAGEIASKLDDWAAIISDDQWSAPTVRAMEAWAAFGMVVTDITDESATYLWGMPQDYSHVGWLQ